MVWNFYEKKVLKNKNILTNAETTVKVRLSSFKEYLVGEKSEMSDISW